VAIRCPACGAELDVALFSFGRAVRCDCGRRIEVDAPHERRVARPARRPVPSAADTLRRRADAITWTILYSDLSEVDVEIAIDALREHVRATLPDRLDLFEMVYVARWRRLREQGWGRNSPG